MAFVAVSFHFEQCGAATFTGTFYSTFYGFVYGFGVHAIHRIAGHRWRGPDGADWLHTMYGNHPDHWHRPLRHGVDPAREDRVELGVVHVAVMLRTIDKTDDGHGLHHQEDLEKIRERSGYYRALVRAKVAVLTRDFPVYR